MEFDLGRPDHDSELLIEILPQAPPRWYLTRFLVPIDADEKQKQDVDVDEEIDTANDQKGEDGLLLTPAGACHGIELRDKTSTSTVNQNLLKPPISREIMLQIGLPAPHSSYKKFNWRPVLSA